MACRTRHRLRRGNSIRRLRPFVQPRTDTGHAHHPPHGAQEGLGRVRAACAEQVGSGGTHRAVGGPWIVCMQCMSRPLSLRIPRSFACHIKSTAARRSARRMRYVQLRHGLDANVTRPWNPLLPARPSPPQPYRSTRPSRSRVCPNQSAAPAAVPQGRGVCTARLPPHLREFLCCYTPYKHRETYRM